jgi:hypothetical protein
LIDEGRRQVIAENAAAIATKVAVRDKIKDEVDAMDEARRWTRSLVVLSILLLAASPSQCTPEQIDSFCTLYTGGHQQGRRADQGTARRQEAPPREREALPIGLSAGHLIRDRNVDWLTFAKEAGAYISPLLMGAVIWLNADRNRLLESLGKKDALLSEKDEKLQSLSERTLVAMTEIKTFLFSAGRRA